MMPIGRLVFDAAGSRLGSLEDKGYFAVGTELLKLVDEVVVNYGPEEVADFGANIVAILDTLRNITQPDVLAVANEATDVLHHADEVKPVGVLGMVGATRDEDVQHGMAIALEILRHLGRTRGSGTSERPIRTRPPVQAAKPATKPAKTARKKGTTTPSTEPVMWEGVAFTADGFLLNSDDWNEVLAAKMADSLGIALTDEHWTVLQWIRARVVESGSSPNVRAVGSGSGVGIKELYRLFPKTPGKTAARLAGVPKPVGCV